MRREEVRKAAVACFIPFEKKNRDKTFIQGSITFTSRREINFRFYFLRVIHAWNEVELGIVQICMSL